MQQFQSPCGDALAVFVCGALQKMRSLTGHTDRGAAITLCFSYFRTDRLYGEPVF